MMGGVDSSFGMIHSSVVLSHARLDIRPTGYWDTLGNGVIPLPECMRMIDWAAVRWSFAATCRASCPRFSACPRAQENAHQVNNPLTANKIVESLQADKMYRGWRLWYVVAEIEGSCTFLTSDSIPLTCSLKLLRHEFK